LLSLALTLIIARLLTGTVRWKESTLAAAFWCMNIGLTLMVVLSLLPIGIAQAVASVNEGLWYARSADFLQQPWLEQLRWFRILGDTVFLVGVGAFAWFMLGLWTGWSREPVSARTPAGAVVPVARNA
jgi:nitric oxide reductase subunit B